MTKEEKGACLGGLVSPFSSSTGKDDGLEILSQYKGSSSELDHSHGVERNVIWTHGL